MTYLYFDESIRENGQFIIGCFVYSEQDVNNEISNAISNSGLQPGKDEYKSSAAMDNDPERIKLRDRISSILISKNICVVIIPSKDRAQLAIEALKALQYFIPANNLPEDIEVFFDQGIPLNKEAYELTRSVTRGRVNFDQDSKIIMGIQLADLGAHYLGTMLLETQGHISKTIKYEYNTTIEDIPLGSEFFSKLRYSIFKEKKLIIEKDIDNDPIKAMTVKTEGFGLYISPLCSEDLKEQALQVFSEWYMGCMH